MEDEHVLGRESAKEFFIMTKNAIIRDASKKAKIGERRHSSCQNERDK